MRFELWLQSTYLVDEEILRLKVPMKNMLVMAYRHSSQKLEEESLQA